MTTNINISVQGRDLVERSKQQQRDARTKRLTTASLTEETEKNRDRVLRDAPSTSTFASRRPTDTGTAPFVRINRPTASRIMNDAFLVVTNENISIENNESNVHTVQITDSSGAIFSLTSVLYTTLGREGQLDLVSLNRTHLFLPPQRTLEDFKRSIVYPYIYSTLRLWFTDPGPAAPEGDSPDVVYIEPTHRLFPFRPRRDTQYNVSLVKALAGPISQNSGGIMAGYFNSPSYYVDEWQSVADPSVYGVNWGATNQDALYFYPPDYPL